MDFLIHQLPDWLGALQEISITKFPNQVCDDFVIENVGVLATRQDMISLFT